MQNNLRKRQTRTKIQLGSLVILSGLAKFLNINQGDDLQLDFDKRDKAYILLGILADTHDNIKCETSLAHFLSKGKQLANN